MEGEFTHGTVAIDKDGVVTDTLFCGDQKVQVTVIIPSGALGDFTSFDHQSIWHFYKVARGRIEAAVKAKCGGLPTESCTITLDPTDLQIQH
ncbi:MAG: hypothetical protein ACLP8A_03400 [Methylovirgula sp.]